MGKANYIQTSFNAGEWSSKMSGLIDHNRRKDAVGEMLNMFPLRQGPAMRRSGSVFAKEVRYSNKTTILIPFQYSIEQAYMLEFGDQYIRFYRNNGAILEATKSITSVTNANPAVVTSAAHGYNNGDEVYISSAAGMTELNGRYYTVANKTANTFELSGINSTSYGVYSGSGLVARTYQISTPYLEADLEEIQFTQSKDTLYLCHNDYDPRTLTRSAHTSWTLSTITFVDGPYLGNNTSGDSVVPDATGISLTPSATTGTGITITASGGMFLSTDVGRLVRIKHSSTWGYARITAYTSATQVTADVVNNFGATTASFDWRLSVYSSANGYPRNVTFFQDRLCFAAGSAYYSRIDMSAVGNYYNFQPSDTSGTIADDDAIAISLNANDSHTISWMGSDEKGMPVGTQAGEWIIRPSQQGGAITPDNIQATQPTNNGCSSIRPVRAGNGTIFVQRSLRNLHMFGYSIDTDGFKTPDLNLFSDHITYSGIRDITYQRKPNSILHCVLNNGKMATMTFDQDQAVTAWALTILGGVSDSSDTHAKIECNATIPSADLSRDEVWVIVKRYINGQTKRYIEYFAKDFEDNDDQASACYVDCSLSYSGSAVSSISGLDHLEGETVSVLANGAKHIDCVVTDGSITLTGSYTDVVIGLPYEWRLETLPPEAGASLGVAQGQTKRITKMTIRFVNSLGVEYGVEDTALDTISFRQTSDSLSTAVPLYTGDKLVDVPAGYTTDSKLLLTGSDPFPVMIAAIMPEIIVRDR